MSLPTFNIFTGATEQEKSVMYNMIRNKLGAPVVGVEIVDSQLETCFAESIEEYSSYINQWALENRMAEMLGLNTDTDFTLKFVANSLYFEKAFAKSYSEQLGLGANGTRELKKDGITLTAGTQDYFIPAGREVNEILWFTPSFINLFGLDPFANTNIAFSEFGASFAGHTLYHVMPVFDTILTAQAAEMRNRVRGSEYSYMLRPGPDGTKRLTLFPIPRPNNGNSSPSLGIGGGAGTPGTLFYFYYDKENIYGNPEFSGTTANIGLTGFTGIGNGLVSGPADAKLDFLPWDQINSKAKRWIKRYAEALAKEILGRNIRGKFSGTLPIPGAELTLNANELASEARDDKSALKEELKNELENLSFTKILEDRASMQESINRSLGFGPLGIYIG